MIEKNCYLIKFSEKPEYVEMFRKGTINTISKILCLYSLAIEDIVDRKISSVISKMEESLGDYYCFFTS